MRGCQSAELRPHDCVPIRKVPAQPEEMAMKWETPTLVEICIGLEINGYLPAEF
jgi:coenzyme PQQ precursor peptide PqqA